jgi:hypothetical protein
METFAGKFFLAYLLTDQFLGNFFFFLNPWTFETRYIIKDLVKSVMFMITLKINQHGQGMPSRGFQKYSRVYLRKKENEAILPHLLSNEHDAVCWLNL